MNLRKYFIDKRAPFNISIFYFPSVINRVSSNIHYGSLSIKLAHLLFRTSMRQNYLKWNFGSISDSWRKRISKRRELTERCLHDNHSATYHQRMCIENIWILCQTRQASGLFYVVTCGRPSDHGILFETDQLLNNSFLCKSYIAMCLPNCLWGGQCGVREGRVRHIFVAMNVWSVRYSVIMQ